MTKVVLASRNKKKITELQELLDLHLPGRITVLSLDEIGYTGEIEEDGASFEENAIIKASVPASLGYIGIADDSGLCVDALDGAPGIFSARFSGEDADDEKNNAKLLRLLENVPDGSRGGAYVCVAACVIPSSMGLTVPADVASDELTDFAARRSGDSAAQCFVCRGECRGELLRGESGEGGFGYDPLFYYPPFGKTFASVTHDEKNSVSHRGAAMKDFADVLGRILG